MAESYRKLEAGGIAASSAAEDDVFLSIAISAYNEERRIGPTIEKIVAYLEARGGTAEIVVNDDGSKDRTAEIVRGLGWPGLRLLVSPVNQGKGGGIRNAVLASRGRYILFTDADLSTPIEEADRLLSAIQDGGDVAIGCRLHPGGFDMRITQPIYRRAFGKLFHALAWLFVIRGIADTQSGFKCFRREVAYDLFAATRLNSIIFDVEVLYLARKRGYHIVEVPVEWTSAGGSRMQVTPKHALTVLTDLLRVPLIHYGQRPRVEVDKLALPALDQDREARGDLG